MNFFIILYYCFLNKINVDKNLFINVRLTMVSTKLIKRCGKRKENNLHNERKNKKSSPNQ